jgi:hypothetical protein
MKAMKNTKSSDTIERLTHSKVGTRLKQPPWPPMTSPLELTAQMSSCLFNVPM